MKLLILRFSAIGDIILTTPVIRCIRKKYPRAQVHYATKPAFSSLVMDNPYVNKVHVLNSSLKSLIGELREEKFDHIIDLHHNQRTWLIKKALGVKSSSLNKLNFEKILLTRFKIDRFPSSHISERMLEVCKPLGVEDDGLGLDYFIPQKDEVDIKRLPAAFQHGYLGWGIGGSVNTKKLPLSKIIEVLRQIYKPVVLLGGKEDATDARAIIEALPGRIVYDACGKYNLNQSASLVHQAELILSNDTSIMHMGAAFKKPVISFWGNTTPRFGMWPYYGMLKVPQAMMEVQGLACHPCSRLGYERCPQGHFNCMNHIKSSEVTTNIVSLLQA